MPVNGQGAPGTSAPVRARVPHRQLSGHVDGIGSGRFPRPRDGGLLQLAQARRTGAGCGRQGKQPIYEVGQGLEQRGQLDRQTSTRVYRVKLAAGKTYVIDMVSPNQPALDPFLVLTDATGKDLAEDDDGGGGLNARIVFRPEQAGTFRILAT